MDTRFIDLLPDLALFTEIGRADSLSGAARASKIPVSRLSRRLSALERALGVRLVERSSRHFRLTIEGETYFASLAPILGDLFDAFATVEDAGQEPSGTLRLTSSPDFGAGFLAKLIADFSLLHPQLAFEVDLTPRQLDLGAERFDAAIRVGPLQDSTLTSRRFATIPTQLFAAKAYLDVAGRPRHPSELAHHRCLPMPHMQGIGAFRQGLEHCEVAMHGPIKANNLMMLRRLCGDGMGVAVLNPMIAAEGGEHCPVERVLPDWELEPTNFYFLTPARLMPARTRAFFNFARSQLVAEGY